MHFSSQQNIKSLYRYFDLIYMKWTKRYVNNDVISEENTWSFNRLAIDIVKKKTVKKISTIVVHYTQAVEYIIQR